MVAIDGIYVSINREWQAFGLGVGGFVPVFCVVVPWTFNGMDLSDSEQARGGNNCDYQARQYP